MGCALCEYMEKADERWRGATEGSPIRLAQELRDAWLLGMINTAINTSPAGIARSMCKKHGERFLRYTDELNKKRAGLLLKDPQA